jgi:predicted nucleotidyltransferase
MATVAYGTGAPDGTWLALARRFEQRLRARVGPALVEARLFGSAARGEADEDSDLDVLVVLEHVGFEERRAVFDIADDFLHEAGVLVSPTLYDRHTWERQLRQERGFAMTVQREGIRL